MNSNLISLTTLQKELWLSHLSLPENHPGISCGIICRLNGIPDVYIFKNALKLLVQQFPLLSSTLKKIDNDIFPVFETNVHLEPQFEFIDLRDKSEPQKKYKTVFSNLKEQPFEPLGGRLCRYALIVINDNESFFFTQYFHLAADGVASLIFVNVLAEIYNKLANHEEVILDAQDWRKDVELDLKHLKSKRYERDIQFWQEYFKDVPEESMFYSKYGKPNKIGLVDLYEHYISNSLMNKFKKFSEEHSVSLNNIFTGLYMIVTGFLFDSNKVTIQVPVRYGEHRNYWAIHGHRVSISPLWIDLIKNNTFELVLKDIQKKVRSFLKRCRTPFQHALRREERLSDYHHIWDSNLAYFSQKLNAKFGNIEVTRAGAVVSKYEPVILEVYPNEILEHKPIGVSTYYSSNHFSKNDIKDFWERFEKLADKVLSSPQKNLKDFSIILPKEKEKLFEFQKGEKRDYIKCSIPELFDITAKKFKNKVAIVGDNVKITYEKLSKRKDKIASWLYNSGVRAGDVVAVLARKEPMLIEALLGIMKLGVIYLPIDPEYPEERINYIISDSNAKKVISLTKEDSEKFNTELLPEDYENINNTEFKESEIAYLIYTSGSTGKPKGVLVKHSGFVNMIQSQIDIFGIKSSDNVLQFASPSFDASLSEIFLALVSGGTLYPVTKQIIIEPLILKEFMEKNKITVATFPPTYLNLFNKEDFASLRVLITAGEPPIYEDALYYSGKLKYFNAYGPTETSVCATIMKFSSKKDLDINKIGKPIPNTEAYILNKQGYPVPPGMPGELCLAGAGLAYGYLNREELNNEKFIQAPFNEKIRIYRTGDKALFHSDGNIVFLGRIDEQVKIRGYRVEPDEIKKVLETFEEISKAEIVAVSGSSGTKELVAFIILEQDKTIDIKNLRKKLSNLLPSFMIPAKFIPIDEFPIGLTGKINRKKLISIAEQVKHSDFKDKGQALTELEKKVCKIFQEILQIPSVSKYDNFFEIGGDSIKLVEVSNRISKEFNKNISIRDIFSNPTIAAIIDKLNIQEEKSQLKKSTTKFIPLNYSQKQLWALYQINPESSQYNMPFAVEFEADNLNIANLKKAILKAIERQPLFRSIITGDIDVPKFKILDNYNIVFEQIDITNYENQEEKCKELFDKFIHKPFNLYEEIPLKVFIITFNNKKIKVLFVMHHIIGDASSLRILIKDISLILKGIKLNPVLPEILVNFVKSEENYLNSNEAETDLIWWKNYLNPLPERINLVSSKRPPYKRGNGDMIKLKLSDEIIQTFEDVLKKEHTTLLTVFVNFVLNFISKESGKENIAVSVPIDLRDSVELQDIAGYFVNTVIVKKSVKDFSNAISHGRLPFAVIAEKLSESRDPSRAPLVDVLVTIIDERSFFYNIDFPENLNVKPVEVFLKGSKLDFSFILKIDKFSRYELIIEFDTDIADRDEVFKIAEKFIKFIKAKDKHSASSENIVHVISNIWKNILGEIPVLGESDFFSSGGDSIKALKMVGELRRHGISSISPADIFAYPSFEQLVNIAKKNKGAHLQLATEKLEIKDDTSLPLLPLQHKLIKSHRTTWHKFFMLLPMKINFEINEDRLEEAIKTLHLRHEALRAKYTDELKAYLGEPVYAPFLERFYVENIDLNNSISKAAQILFRRIDVRKGKNFGAILLFHNEETYLLLGGHHITLDAVSLDIIEKEILWFCKYGKWPEIVETTSPFLWASKLLTSKDLWEPEREKWLKICSINSNLEFFKQGNKKVGRRETIIKKVKEISELAKNRAGVLSSFAHALYEQGVKEKLLILMEGHGREKIFPDIDVSQSVGWFTVAYPMPITPCSYLEQGISEIEDWFKELKFGGLEYGILSMLEPEQFKNNALISFNYYGKIQKDTEGVTPLIDLAFPSKIPSIIDNDFEPDTLLDFIIFIDNNELNIVAWFSPDCVDKKFLNSLLKSWENTLTQNYKVPTEWEKAAKALKTPINNIKYIFEPLPQQEAMLFQYLLEGRETFTYSQQITFSLKGKIDTDIFSKAWHITVNRHDALNGIFPTLDTGDTKWVILKKGIHLEEFIDLSHLPDSIKEKELSKRKYQKSFFLEQGPLLYMSLYKLSDKNYEMTWDFHHILMDGWCIGILLKELFTIYNALMKKEEPALEKPPLIQDYISWYNRYNKKEALNFWKHYLKDITSITPVIKNFTKTPVKQMEFIEGSIYEDINSIATNLKTSQSIIIQCAWAVILYSIQETTQQRVVFGLVTSGRPIEVKNIENMVGLFIQTIPVKIEFNEKDFFSDLVKKEQAQVIKRMPYEYISLSDIQKCSKINGELFDHILVFENYPVDGIEQQGAPKIENVTGIEQHPYNLGISVIFGEELKFRFSYNPAVISKKFATKLFNLIEKVLKAIIDNSNIKVEDLVNICKKNIKEDLTETLEKFNNTFTDYPKNKSLFEVFEEISLKYPDKIAIIDENNKTLTYKELYELSLTVASNLNFLKIGEPVAVAMERGIFAIPVFLGILKAGGCYLPLDMKNPLKRIKVILEKADCSKIICDEVFYETIKLDNVDLYFYKDLFQEKNIENVPKIEPIFPAYIMFTSGTTGEPKGVVVPHRAVIRIACNNGFLDVAPDDKVLQGASLGFDASTFEIWSALLNGATLCCISDETLLNPESFKEFIKNNGITIMWLTSTLCNLFVDEDITIFSNIKTLLTGGEVLSVPHISKLIKSYPKLKIINGYGPTENTVFTTTHLITEDDLKGDSIPIGRPVGNTRAYICREDNSLAHLGEWGELYAAGDGLAIGYVGDKEATEKSFIYLPPPISERVYKTGDIARWREDGVIEFKGRKDSQVKLRGYRIELDEIEKILNGFTDVSQSIVLSIGIGEDKKIIAFIKSKDKDITEEKIKDELLKFLPTYMVPNEIIFVDKFPVNVNGKVDKKLLIQNFLNFKKSNREIIETSSSGIEEKIAEIFSELLEKQVSPSNINASFFELGGQSLKAVRLLTRINALFNVELSLKDIFSGATIKSIAARIRELTKLNKASFLPSLKYAGDLESYQMSSSQERIWFLQCLYPESCVYNVPFALTIQGGVNIEALKNAIYLVESKYDALRIRVPKPSTNLKLLQKIAEPGAIKLKIYDYRKDENPEDKVETEINNQLSIPFSFGMDSPLVKVALFLINNEKSVLLLIAHHLICDGVSSEIIIRDIIKAYETKDLDIGQNKIRYVDYALWQKNLLKSNAGIELRERWIKRLTPLAEPINLPIDKPRPAIRGFEGAVHRFRINRDVSSKLLSFAKSKSLTPFEIFSAIVYIFLYRHTFQEKIVLGVPVSGRVNAEVENLVGCFVNTIPVPFTINPDKNFNKILEDFSKIWLECFEDQIYPFEEIVEALNINRDPSRNPIFDVLVAFEESSWISFEKMGGLKLTPFSIPHKFSKFDLSFYFRQIKDEFEIDIEYSTELFKNSSIKMMEHRFKTLTQSLLENPDASVKTVKLLPEKEKEKILNKFNDTFEDYNVEHTIDEMLLAQVKKIPEAVALIEPDGRKINFKELNENVERISKGLASILAKGSYVGVCFNRCSELMEAIFSVLRAGCVYVPFVPGLPKERKKFMIEDAGVKAVICDEQFAEDFKELGVEPLIIDNLHSDIDYRKSAAPSDVAYIIFTSGSTGRPKGVMIEHRSIINRILWMQSTFPIKEGDVIIQKTPISFDVSIWELFWWSWTGATLAQLPIDGEKDPSVIVDIIEKRKGTIIHFVPSMLNIFLQYLEKHKDEVKRVKSLKYVISSGEALTPELVNRFNNILYKTYKIELHNLYGPTEAAVDVTWYSCSPFNNENTVPIGRPIANTKMYIFDKFNNLSPIGVTGELFISGIQVARGYINRDDLTKESFMKDPFHPNLRMYKTGDIGRWRGDGNIEYLGRKDNQVKIRGFRIELGEIEAALEKIEGIVQAVARITEIGSMPAIEAFLLKKNEVTFTRESIRSELAKILPEYMIPSRFYEVKSIPLNQSGKADRKRLKGTLIGRNEKVIDVLKEDEAENDIEKDILDEVYNLWRKVLSDKSEFGINDNFFEIGGNSLLLIQLHEFFEEKWPGVFSVPDLFVYVTVSQQVKRIVDFGVKDNLKKLSSIKKDLTDEPVAIIGMALKLANYDNIDSFWMDITKGVDRTCELSEERKKDIILMLKTIGFNLTNYQFREEAYLDDISAFDAEYFGLAPVDVMFTEPEQRLLLETVFRAIEDSGYGGNTLNNKNVGVFVGGSPSSLFKDGAFRSFPEKREQVYVLNVPSNIASRPGYLKNWRGPAELIDTACSSALKALLDACKSIQNGECEIALVGGAKIDLMPLKGDKKFTIESGSGKTKTFDAEADGVGAGEGAVAFVLKRLSKAIDDGDSIRAVIKGGAVNQDGQAASIAAPNPEAQAEVIINAAKNAKTDLLTIDFFEAHGTGTILGDPIEIDGITRAFKNKYFEPGKIAIGSVKANFGHLDAAAGALGLAKAVIALERGIFPKQINFNVPNPRINFEKAPVFIPVENYHLDKTKKPWRCGVSSFGLSGINVHVILEEPPLQHFEKDNGKLYFIPISAGSESSLLKYVELILKKLNESKNIPISSVSGTLVTGRYHLKHRIAFIASSVEELINLLKNWQYNENRKIYRVKPLNNQFETGGFFSTKLAKTAIEKFLDGSTPVWNKNESFKRIHLPPVPLNRKRFWPNFKSNLNIFNSWFISMPVESPDGKVFNIPIDNKSFWPAYEHRLNNRPLLVGMAVISFIGEASFLLNENIVVLIENLQWKSPMFADEVKSACLILKENGESFVAKVSGKIGKNEHWKDYSFANLKFLEPNKTEHFNVHKLIASMKLVENKEVLREESILKVSKRWHCRKNVWIAENGNKILGELEIPKEFSSDIYNVMWHPAMLDVAASLAIDSPGFVPAECKNVKLFKPITNTVYALVNKNYNSKKGSILADCTILNKNGDVLVKFQEILFVKKRIPEPKLFPVIWKPKINEVEIFNNRNLNILIIGETSLLKNISKELIARGDRIDFCKTPDNYLKCLKIADKINKLKISLIIWEVPENENSWLPLFRLLKTIVVEGIEHPLNLAVLSKKDNFFSKISMGMILSIAKEEPLIHSKFVEIADEDNSQDIINEVVHIGEVDDKEAVVLVKEGEIFIRDIGEEIKTIEIGKLEKDGVVIFTGGLGAMSLTLAYAIGKRFGVKVALIYRKPLPDKVNEKDEDLIWKINKLNLMKEEGIKFKLYESDVCNKDRLGEVIEDIRKNFGKIIGIVHTAGIAGEGFLIKKDEDKFESVISPKVKGALNLHYLTLQDNLEFFVLASSRTGIYGAPGQTDYAGANAWLDSFAAWRRSIGLPAVSIDWNTWAEIGMAAKMKSKNNFSKILPKQAEDIFIRSLFVDTSQIVIIMSDEEKQESRIKTKKKRENIGELEEEIRLIWKEELGYEDSISDSDDFFELGGDSITGMNIINRINSDFDISLSIADIFDKSVLKSFIQLIKEKLGVSKTISKKTVIEKAPSMEAYPLSNEQLAVIQAVVSAPSLNTAYNLPQFIELAPNVDLQKLEYAFNQIIERHEILRTFFIDISSPEPKMKILPALSFKLEQINIERIDEKILQGLIEPFDLTLPPLFRAKILIDKNKQIILFLDFHHSIADARTIDILLSELINIYEGKALNIPIFQQKDSAWIQKKQTANIEEAKNYWLSKFYDEIPLLNLPVDMPRPATHTGKGATFNFEIPKELISKIRELARALSTTTYNIMLTIWHILIGMYCNRNKVVIAAAVDNRDRKEFANTTGMFVSLLPLLLEYSEFDTFSSLVKRNHAFHSDALKYRAFNLNSLIKELKLPVMPERTVLSEVTFSYMNFTTALPKDSSIFKERLKINNPSSKADIAIFVTDMPDYMEIALEYYADIFTENRMKLMSKHFLNLLNDILEKGYNKKITEYSLEVISKKIDTYIPLVKDNLLIAISESLNKIDFVKARKVAFYLKEKGVNKGDIVKVDLKDYSNFSVIVSGIFMCGAVCGFGNTNEKDVKVIITDAQEIFNLNEIEQIERVSIDDKAVVIFSDKGKIYLTHGDILKFALQFREVGLKEGSNALVLLSLETAECVSSLFAIVINGCSAIYCNPSEEYLISNLNSDILITTDVLARRLLKWYPASLIGVNSIVAFGDLPDTGLNTDKLISCFMFKDIFGICCIKKCDGKVKSGNVRGKPATGVDIEIVDKNGKTVPYGVWGFAKFKFFNNPVSNEIKGRWNIDGDFEIIGVTSKLEDEDSLLIYNALMEIENVKEVVVWKDNEHEDFKVAVSASEEVDNHYILKHIRRKLPVRLSNIKPHITYKPLPLTSNGEVAVNLIWLNNHGDSIVNISDIEKTIIKIFQEIFGVEIYRDDSFFELGGHSLLALQIANRISDIFSKKVTIADIFAFPTPAELAEFVIGGDKNSEKISISSKKKFKYPLSHAQQRLYVIHNIEGGDIACNMYFAASLKGSLDISAFSKALEKLAYRHEILRTTFVEEDGEIWQIVHEKLPNVIKVDFFDNISLGKVRKIFIEEMEKPFVLSKLPLFRWRVIVTRKETFLILVMHHIIGDGWSMQIMFSELINLYNAENRGENIKLKALPIQYRDYALWQQQQDWSTISKYWKNELKGVPYNINLPKDFPEDSKKQWPLGVTKRVIPKELMINLRNIVKIKKVSLATFMLSVFTVLLYRLTGQKDMLVGLGVAGRERVEVENLIGFFINILPIRVKITEDTNFNELLEIVNHKVLTSVKYQDYPFDLLVKELSPKRKGGRESIINVVFEYQRYGDIDVGVRETGITNTFDYKIIDLDEVINIENSKKLTSKYDLTFFVLDEPANCCLKAEFDRGLFKMETVEKWLKYYENFLKMIIQELMNENS